jgi:hypothetical protein
MKQLAGIKLNESVMAVPGIGGSESDMQTAGTIGRDQAYAAYDAAQTPVTEKAPPGMEDMVMKLKKEYPGHPEKAFATAWSIYNKKHGKKEESVKEAVDPEKVDELAQLLKRGDISYEEFRAELDSLDHTDYSMRQGEMGMYGGDTAAGHHAWDMERSEWADDDLARAEQNYIDREDFEMDEGAEDTNYQEHGEYERSDEITQALADFENMVNNLYMDPNDAHARIVAEFDDPATIEAFNAALEQEGFGEHEPDDSMDGDFDSGMASAGYGSDEDYGYYGGDEEFEEAAGKRASDIDPNEVNSMMRLPHEAAVARAQEILAASTTSDNKKSYLANQLNRSRNTQQVVKLLYDMILKGEGHGVQGSSYSKKFDEEFDLQNGYDDINDANGCDYFPNGADSPVVKDVGPSGARQGDNPEQKKMQIAELHKELVYNYRDFLSEASQKKKLTEMQAPAKASIQDLYADFDNDGETITYNGPVGMHAVVTDVNGRPYDLDYTVDVVARSHVDWEESGNPTGWNYKNDSPTYSDTKYPTANPPEITSISFNKKAEFLINGEVYTVHDFQRQLGPSILKQLLNPALYENEMKTLFDREAENMESDSGY